MTEEANKVIEDINRILESRTLAMPARVLLERTKYLVEAMDGTDPSAWDTWKVVEPGQVIPENSEFYSSGIKKWVPSNDVGTIQDAQSVIRRAPR